MLHLNKKYYTQTADQEDLISIGTIGLIKGISTFDAAKGARLATYAARCVENEILMHFRAQRKTASDVSLSDYIETGKDGNALSLMDTVCSEEDLFDDLSARELHAKLYEVMQRVLTPRERAVIALRYGLGDRPAKTQREIAAQLGISRSYVSRIEKKPSPRSSRHWRRRRDEQKQAHGLPHVPAAYFAYFAQCCAAVRASKISEPTVTASSIVR